MLTRKEILLGNKNNANDAPGMKGNRSRDENGELRQKRSDTLIRTIEREYGVDLGVRGDMKLETLRAREGTDSLKKILRKHE